jgi:hypothetical protein
LHLYPAPARAAAGFLLPTDKGRKGALREDKAEEEMNVERGRGREEGRGVMERWL